MYFSRVRPDPHPSASPPAIPPRDAPYREHQLLWGLFAADPEADRDFLFRRDNSTGAPVFYLLSRRIPQSSDGVWQIDTKPFEPQLRPGQPLAFSLRANPVVTRRGDDGKSRRHDIVMDLKHRAGWQQLPQDRRTPLPRLMQDAAEQWLAPRLANAGATLDTVQAQGYQQHRHQKAGKAKPIRFSSLDLVGQLTVGDPEVFTNTLMHGIGPAKAFGCGLLLVRRC